MAQAVLQQPPQARHMVEIAGLVFAPPQPDEVAQVAGRALGAEDRIGAREGRHREIGREPRPLARIDAEKLQLEIGRPGSPVQGGRHG